ncbi:RHS repeat-associated core domain-containing protein [Nitrosomonas aestuarii]|uniref:RHS repeat-associated core domain-containing protein n=1 Tax=Nitrosomonas aestuarii TaxID=52441 RepID=A0A1I4D3S6_9PROT|nr:SpvB/TcaC N-terminal domain-containing protein [Nitrosomonas aestuarii]SFK87077.1 RHS repeat-associated core domain-containing protein [Nitrosomonas aestuarii]
MHPDRPTQSVKPNTNSDASQTGQGNAINNLTKENPSKTNAIEIPQISLPQGGGALKGIDEKFEVNAANGTASFSVSLPISPGRNGFSPSLALSYNSGGGNSPYGLGWSVDYPMIQRKTDKRLPRYQDGQEEDIFMFSGSEDLVPYLDKDGDEWIRREQNTEEVIIHQYRPRTEGGIARIERITRKDTSGIYWKVTTPDNTTTFFGLTQAAQLFDPENPTKIYAWLPSFSFDDKGNWIIYEYKAENSTNVPNDLHEKNRLNGPARFTNRYLKRVKYCNRTPWYSNHPYIPNLPEQNVEHFFELVMDYGEHKDPEVDDQPPDYNEIRPWNLRPDAFSSYRSGFEVRTYRRCFNVLMFHHFPEETQWDESDFGRNYLVRSLSLNYQPSSINESGQTEVSYLQSIIQKGYIRQADNSYSVKQLPPMEFEYQQLLWNTQVRVVDRKNIANAPVGLTGNYQWVDLYGEGINGILTEQAEGWFYKSNFGDIDEDHQVRFSQALPVIPKPSFTGLTSGALSIQDLEANGQKQVVVNSPGMQGYYELTTVNDVSGYKPFQSFERIANINLQDPNTRLLDLNGDGQPELVMTEECLFVWFTPDGKKGYSEAEYTVKVLDEERGPALVFANKDQQESIFLADMTGDGLTDIIRVRNGEICYWANMGYGQFSAKVTMSNSPVFDEPDLFNPQYLQLADISGTGATDIIYLGKNQFKAFINLSGNAWSDVHEIDPFFPIDSNSQLSVIDLLGTGTSCIVWSTDLPEESHAPMRYIDLMDSKKPHVLTKYVNNFGKETTLEYKSSTYYYLKDKQEGTPWITKLPFPVQVIAKSIVEDKITYVRFSSEYRYHHGYYDHPEREFRGFGMVEQRDTEEYETWQSNNAGNQLEKSEDLYQAPILVKTWFHTGAFLDLNRILTHFREEYWHEQYNRCFPDAPITIQEPELQDARIVANQTIADDFNIYDLNAEEYREALRACKGMVLRQEVFSLDAPTENPSIADRQKQLKPYSVATHNCHVQLLQPRGNNLHAVFIVTESEAVTINYERDETDPRIAHTLNVQIDELGKVLEAAAVVYPRLQVNPDLPLAIQQEQAKTLITYTRNRFTQDIDQPDIYRLRAATETETFELTGLTKNGPLYALSDFEAILTSNSNSISYQETATEGITQRRLIEHVRTVYYDENFTVALPLGQQSSHGIPFESYQLAYTPELLQTLFGGKIADAEDLMANEGQYVHSEGDNNWWIRSGTTNFLADNNETLETIRNRFYSPVSYTSPFGATTAVEYYKDYFFILQATEDTLQNRVSVERFNFRTLSPIRMRDINDNLSEIVTDELGLVKATAVMGKGDEADNLESFSEITSPSERSTVQTYFTLEDWAILRNTARSLLGNATARFVYDFDRYRTTAQSLQQQLDDNPALGDCERTDLSPTVTGSIAREQHHSINPNSPLQLSFEYTDGMGNVAMVKAQAEPGEALNLVVQDDCTFTLETIDTRANNQLRWIGNGRTVLNNKGTPVKQYEPYFSVNFFYEDHKALVGRGVTPIIYYDAIGRNIRTELPDGTFSRIEFDSWQQRSYDPNDTVQDSAWYSERGSPDPQANEPTVPEQRAAWLAASHHDTPATVHLDTLGRPVLSIEHNRIEQIDQIGNITGFLDEYPQTRITLDIEGNARAIIDARGNTVMTYGYNLLGTRVYQLSMDAGERWTLANVAGNPMRAWDSRNHVVITTYDILQRPLTMRVQGGDGDTQLDNIFDRIIYGENSPNDRVNNLRGQSLLHYDTAGRVQNSRFDFKGNLLEGSRRFAADYKNVVNWPENNPDTLLDGQAFTQRMEYDALNRTTRSITPDGSSTTLAYNAANLLETISVTQQGRTQEFVSNIDYDEKGQRQSITYGNGVITTYTYDPLTFRLLHLETRGVNNQLLQDLRYVYDPVGNITEIEDRAIPTVFFDQQIVEPKSHYRYDALYRLIFASGKEHAGQIDHALNDNFDDLPFLRNLSPGDPMAWRNYRQQYQYDAVGNIQQMRHTANGGSWTRDYAYETNNNRLMLTIVGSHTYTYPHHVQHGFMTSMPHLSLMSWNFKDELQAVARQVVNNGVPETTYYVYDGSGQRVRKVTENPGGGTSIKDERLYLGGVEIYRKRSGNNVGLERTTLHVMDDQSRIAMIDTRNGVDDGTDARTVRYQLGNHLGSAALEVNENGRVIGYEEYHPYGTTAYQAKDANVRMAAKRYRYTGMERDEETGFGYHGARYYVPWLGRWVSADPIGVRDGVNLYGYVRGSPITLEDPLGSKGMSPFQRQDRIASKEEEIVAILRQELQFLEEVDPSSDEAESLRETLQEAELSAFVERAIWELATDPEASEILSAQLVHMGLTDAERRTIAESIGERSTKLQGAEYQWRTEAYLDQIVLTARGDQVTRRYALKRDSAEIAWRGISGIGANIVGASAYGISSYVTDDLDIQSRVAEMGATAGEIVSARGSVKRRTSSSRNVGSTAQEGRIPPFNMTVHRRERNCVRCVTSLLDAIRERSFIQSAHKYDPGGRSSFLTEGDALGFFKKHVDISFGPRQMGKLGAPGDYVVFNDFDRGYPGHVLWARVRPNGTSYFYDPQIGRKVDPNEVGNFSSYRVVNN